MEWISVKDRLPDIDYANEEVSCRVRIKVDDQEVSDKKCYYTHIFSVSESGCPFVKGHFFYDLPDGNTYNGVTHWMSLPEPPNE